MCLLGWERESVRHSFFRHFRRREDFDFDRELDMSLFGGERLASPTPMSCSHISLDFLLLHILFFHFPFLSTSTQFFLCNIRFTLGPPLSHFVYDIASPFEYFQTPVSSLSFSPEIQKILY